MWKPTISFPNWEASEDGRVRRRIVSKYDNKARFAVDGYYYPEPRMSSGYYCVGATDTYMIHRMVAEAFIPNPNNYPFVNHLDGNKLNNCVDNLEWCTPKQNSQHAVSIGLIKTGKDSHMYGKKGDKHPCHVSNLGNKWNVGRKASKETRQKISCKLKGNKNGLGHHPSEETRRKMSEAAKLREARKRDKRGV